MSARNHDAQGGAERASLDPEVSRAAALEEDTERRHEDGEEDLDD